jgi:hypothetical protein
MILRLVPRRGLTLPDTPQPISETLKRPLTCTFNVNDR